MTRRAGSGAPLSINCPRQAGLKGPVQPDRAVADPWLNSGRELRSWLGFLHSAEYEQRYTGCHPRPADEKARECEGLVRGGAAVESIDFRPVRSRAGLAAACVEGGIGVLLFAAGREQKSSS